MGSQPSTLVTGTLSVSHWASFSKEISTSLLRDTYGYVSLVCEAGVSPGHLPWCRKEVGSLYQIFPWFLLFRKQSLSKWRAEKFQTSATAGDRLLSALH